MVCMVQVVLSQNKVNGYPLMVEMGGGGGGGGWGCGEGYGSMAINCQITD